MAGLTVTVPHSLERDEATRRVKGLMSRLRQRYAGRIRDVDEWWGKTNGDFSFELMGQKIKGTVDVAHAEVRTRLDLPFAALMFRGTIESTVKTELRACLEGGS